MFSKMSKKRLVLQTYFFLIMYQNKNIPRLVLKSMDSLYIEELRNNVNDLMIRLESVPVTKGGGGFQKFKKHGRNQSMRDHSADENPELNLSKVDTQLNFVLEVSLFYYSLIYACLFVY